jgi:DNA-binding XRE family transcriptional regulator
VSITTKTCPKGGHDFQGGGSCVRCGYHYRCTCGALIRQDSLKEHLKFACDEEARMTRRLSLVDLREKASLTQQELADRAKVNVITIYRLENARGIPSLPTCLRIAEVLSEAIGDTVLVEDVMRG